MDQLINTLRGLDQDQAVVALFAGVLVASVATVVVVAVLRSLGRWGVVAVAVAAAAVFIANLTR